MGMPGLPQSRRFRRAQQGKRPSVAHMAQTDGASRRKINRGRPGSAERRRRAREGGKNNGHAPRKTHRDVLPPRAAPGKPVTARRQAGRLLANPIHGQFHMGIYRRTPQYGLCHGKISPSHRKARKGAILSLFVPDMIDGYKTVTSCYIISSFARSVKCFFPFCPKHFMEIFPVFAKHNSLCYNVRKRTLSSSKTYHAKRTLGAEGRGHNAKQ
jgi:hypothetical protein